MTDFTLDNAIDVAKASAAVVGHPVSIWRYLDVDQGYAVSEFPRPGRPVNCVCQVNPDGKEFWS